MKIKDMLYALWNKPHIVEQGQTDGWSYRKWDDGTAECWGQFTKTTSPASDNHYMLKATYPFRFTENPSVVATGSVGNQYSYVSYTAVYWGCTDIYLDSPTTSSQTIVVCVYAIGKWK